MIELTEYEKEYWKERASEPLGFKRLPDEVCDEINRTHPMMSEEEAWEIVRKSQGIEE